MGRPKSNKKVMSIRVNIQNEPELKKIVKEKDKELSDLRDSKTIK